MSFLASLDERADRRKPFGCALRVDPFSWGIRNENLEAPDPKPRRRKHGVEGARGLERSAESSEGREGWKRGELSAELRGQRVHGGDSGLLTDLQALGTRGRHRRTERGEQRHHERGAGAGRAGEGRSVASTGNQRPNQRPHERGGNHRPSSLIPKSADVTYPTTGGEVGETPITEARSPRGHCRVLRTPRGSSDTSRARSASGPASTSGRCRTRSSPRMDLRCRARS